MSQRSESNKSKHRTLRKFVEEEEVKEYKDIEGKMKELDTLLDKVYWYDAKVFD